MRIVHQGHASLLLTDDRGRALHVDPWEPTPGALVILTGGPWPERYRGALRSTGATFVAPRALHERLRDLGPVLPLDGEVAGIRIEAATYLPPRDHLADRVRAGLLHPLRAAGRGVTRLRVPMPPPHAVRIGLPGGHVVVHLGVSLHRDTPVEWLDEARRLCQGATAVLAGPSHGQDDDFEHLVRELAPERVLVTDLVHDQRRLQGLPVGLLTPVRDRLVRHGLEAHPFVAGAAVRFSEDVTTRQW